MKIRLIIPIIAFCAAFVSSDLQADDELVLEAAMGVASYNKPFTSDWRGSLGSDGLLMREFAFRTTYNYTHGIGFSSAIGYLSDWDKPRYIFYFDRPDLWERLEIRRRIVYLEPEVRLTYGQFNFNFGALIYSVNTDSLREITENTIFNQSGGLLPAFGLKIGEPEAYLYVNFDNSFPLISGGGVVEFGIGGQYREIYEQKLYFSTSGYQDLGVGYRGEFRIYKKTAITPGFSLGGRECTLSSCRATPCPV